MKAFLIKGLLSLTMFTMVLFIGELYLRKQYTPGYQTHYSGFQIVDSLIVYDDYTTDKYGNYVLSSLITDSLKLAYNPDDCSITQPEIYQRIASVDGVKKVLNDFCLLKNHDKPKFEFEVFAQNLVDQILFSSTDSAYLEYINFPFNSYGFRSIPFKNHNTEKPKILLVGDSFVWGMSAKPYYNSFADLLSARGYIVYNAGIVSVDPIQYLEICKHFVDLIQPDLVIINFYEDNDLLNYDRIHQHGMPHEHITNAGFFNASPEGKHLTAEEAYSFYASKMRIPKKTVLDRLLAKTAIGSILWTKLHPNRTYSFFISKSMQDRISLTKKYSDQIIHVLSDKKQPFFISITPNDRSNLNQNKSVLSIDTSSFNKIFNNLVYYYPRNLGLEDYNQPQDFHFNNSGSLKYANFIDSLIQIKLSIE